MILSVDYHHYYYYQLIIIIVLITMIFSVEMKRSTSVLGWFSPSGAWMSSNNHI